MLASAPVPVSAQEWRNSTTGFYLQEDSLASPEARLRARYGSGGRPILLYASCLVETEARVVVLWGPVADRPTEVTVRLDSEPPVTERHVVNIGSHWTSFPDPITLLRRLVTANRLEAATIKEGEPLAAVFTMPDDTPEFIGRLTQCRRPSPRDRVRLRWYQYGDDYSWIYLEEDTTATDARFRVGLGGEDPISMNPTCLGTTEATIIWGWDPETTTEVTVRLDREPPVTERHAVVNRLLVTDFPDPTTLLRTLVTADHLEVQTTKSDGEPLTAVFTMPANTLEYVGNFLAACER